LTQLRARRSAWRTSIQGRVNLRHRPDGSSQDVRVQVRAENGDILKLSPVRPVASEHVLTPGELSSEPFAAAIPTRRLAAFAASHPDQSLSLRVLVDVGSEKRSATVPSKHLDVMLRREAP